MRVFKVLFPMRRLYLLGAQRNVVSVEVKGMPGMIDPKFGWKDPRGTVWGFLGDKLYVVKPYDGLCFVNLELKIGDLSSACLVVGDVLEMVKL